MKKINKMRLKSNIKVQGIRAEMLLAVLVMQQIADDFGVDLVITSCREGKHSVNSKHKLGYAIDIRSRELSDKDKVLFAQQSREALTDEYLFLIESDHFHLQFDGGFL